MADHSNTDTIPFHSQSPSSLSPCGSKLKAGNEDEYKHFQDTVPFDDTMVLDSPLVETQLEKLDFDTQVVDDPEEVVLDSEDEGIHGTKVVSVANGLSFDRTYRRVKRNGLGLQKRQFSPPCEQAADSDASADEKCDAGIKGCSVNNTEGIDGGKALTRLHACEHDFARLNYVDSQEPGESSQANALDFVDHFLSSSNVDLSPVIDPRNTFREKSPPVSSAKGPQSLAKRIKLSTPIVKTGTFEWVDSDLQGGGNFCNKRMDASFGFGGFRQRSVRRNQRARHPDSKGGSSTANECKEKKDLVNLQMNITNLTHSYSTFVENNPKEICKMEQVSEMKLENNSVRELDEHLHAESSGQQLEASSFERDALDMFDVGINTQIAAEAMEALLNAPYPGCSAGDAYPGPQNTLKDSPRDATNTKSHMEQAFLQKNTFSDSGDIARKTKRKRSARKFSTRTSSSSRKHSKNQELDPELAITTKAKVGKLFDGQLNCRNLAYANESSGRSFNPIDQRKTKGAVGVNNILEFKNYMSSSTPVKHISLGNGQSQGEPVARRTRQWMAGGTLKGTKDLSDNIGEKMNDGTAGGILTYKRKRRHLVANPYDVFGAKEKCSKLCFNTLEEVRNSKWEQQEQTDLHVASITSGLKSDAWSYPKGKRSRRKMQSHSNGASNLSAPPATFNEKESITNSTKSQKRSEGKNVELRGSECTTAVNSTEGINVASSKKMPDEYHRKPCNKNLPKSYLLRELIRLGIPESIPNLSWKDLRRRRDMACVRVLFSQHLDDDIIRQQKKILARLGIFIASCSVDATHFIADRFVRTRNMLEAIALGKPVVTPLWLECCGQASCLIDVKNYILRDAKKEKEIGFGMPVSLAHASQHPLLKGQRVFITPNIKPDKEMISSLVKTVHGKAVERNQIPLGRDQKIPDDLLILSCEEDQAMCMPFLDKGAAVYSSELLLNGIVIQKLEYERHQLFINHVKRNRPNRRSRRDAAL